MRLFHERRVLVDEHRLGVVRAAGGAGPRRPRGPSSCARARPGRRARGARAAAATYAPGSLESKRRARGSGARAIARPLFTPANAHGTTSWPKSATSHCTGRPKVASRSAQRIDLRKGMAAHTRSRARPQQLDGGRGLSRHGGRRRTAPASASGPRPSRRSRARRRHAQLRRERFGRLGGLAVLEGHRLGRTDDLLVEVELARGHPLDEDRQPPRACPARAPRRGRGAPSPARRRRSSAGAAGRRRRTTRAAPRRQSRAAGLARRGWPGCLSSWERKK